MKINYKIFPPIILGTIAIIVVYLLARWLKGRSAIAEIEKDIQPNQLSYAESQYFIFADIIQAATQSITGDNEENIYNVFSQMHTNSDVLQLIVAFGNRTYWGGSGFFYNASLNEVLQTKLSTSEIEHINTILANNQITITI
jgi:hypothetical protein